MPAERRQGAVLDGPGIRRRHLRRGVVCLALGAFCGVSLVIGWIVAGGDPNFHVGGRGYGLPLWLSSIWIGAFGAGLIAFGVSQLRIAALFRDDDRDRDGDGDRDSNRDGDARAAPTE